MKNIVSYAEEMMLGFEEKPFSAVDSLVLSQLSYLHFEGIVYGPAGFMKKVKLKDALHAENFPKLLKNVLYPQNNRELLYRLAISPRFRNIELSHYVNEFDEASEKQFAALMFSLPDGGHYIAFRGTDETFVGWREDFNMAFSSPVPSQTAAVHYLENIAPRRGYILVGGHSKGGNLAVYSALKCKKSIKERILRIYSHDGPGFQENLIRAEDFRGIRDRIEKTIPQDSIIGLLLEHKEGYKVVESSRAGVMQHDPFSWNVTDEGEFVYRSQLTTGAMLINRTIADWVKHLNEKQRSVFVDALFEVIDKSGIENTAVLGENRTRDAANVIKGLKNVDADTKKVLLETTADFAKASIRAIQSGRKQ